MYEYPDFPTCQQHCKDYIFFNEIALHLCWKLFDHIVVDLFLNSLFNWYVGLSSCQYHNNLNAAAKSLQSCPTLCDPIDGSPPSSPVPGILQARTLEWVAISFSNAWKWKVKGKSLSCVWLLATPWTAAYQAPLSMGFSRQEYWSGVPSPFPLPTLRRSKCTDGLDFIP